MNAEKIEEFNADSNTEELKSIVSALHRVQAVIEFDLKGNILTANDNFLNVLGYNLNEIQGKHHRIFCDNTYATSFEYTEFWKKLNRGEFETGEFKRISKDGREIWINASYNPVYDKDGNVYKVIKFATDTTEQKIRNADYEGKINAIGKSQAVIEFNLDGTIIEANENFLKTVGYTAEEVKGKHHRIFCDSAYTSSQEYRDFWTKLGNGDFDSGEYKRFTKEGKPVWINASYNPILNPDGKVYKVVKFATDLTKEKMAYNNLVDTFEQAAGELAVAAEQISSASNDMTMDASETLKVSENASEESVNVSIGVQNVSSSTEELNASIQELSQSSLKASTFSSDAKIKTESAKEIIDELGIASEDIGNIIKVISSIAQQTNLLALNATIEAARAGESGKGFAVVASEVKELAKQTAKATDDISNKILNIQDSTKQAIGSVEDVNRIVTELNSIATNTASAIEEQSAVTRDVSRILVESSAGVENITNILKTVTHAASKSSTGAKGTLESAIRLGELSEKLKTLVMNAKTP